MNGPLTLYHGTLRTHARNMQRHGVNPALGRPGTDFGPGFYTTTCLLQARSWAWLLAAQQGGAASGAVVELLVDRDALAGLDSLAFVRGHYDADDFWSFVFQCRQGAADHGRKAASGFFDVVCGPVAAFWMQRMAVQDADQMSFHTPAAAGVLQFQQTILV